jgi:hypothetical protein
MKKKIGFIVVCLLFFSCSYMVDGYADLILFTDQDAAQLDLDQLPEKESYSYFSQHIFPTRTVSAKGPRIKFMQPPVTLAAKGPTLETQSPTDLIVSFGESSSGNPADMSTLEVVGKKGFFKKALTDKLKPYIVGSQIKATNIKIPNGKFHLQISIADTAGVETIANYLLVVR